MTDTIYRPFPDDQASNKEKESDDYGKQVGQAIESYWFNGGNLLLRRQWIDEMRAYSKGEQTTDYKATIEGERENKKNELDIKTHKIDYTPLKILSPFKDVMVNSIDESLFKPKAEAIDISSIKDKKEKLKKFDENFFTQDINKIISEGLGIDIQQKNLPKTEEELEIQKLEFKPNIEIVQELAIENVMKHQKFETIKDKIDEDLFDLGVAVGKHHTDFNEGIILEYVDPYNWIHNEFETDDGRDIRYHGVLKKDTIAVLSKRAGGLTQVQLDLIIEKAMGEPTNSKPYVETEDGDRLVEYIDFAYLVQKDRVFKKLRKNKSVKIIDRSEDEQEFQPSNEKKKIKIPYQTWYQGVYIPLAEIIVEWDQIKNQIEEGVNEPICPFLVYAPKVKRLSEKGHIRFDGMTGRVKSLIDDMNRDHFKFQQLKMELMPSIKIIDTDAITNVVLSGQPISGQTILDLYFGRGVLLTRGSDDDNEPLPRAVTEQTGGINNTAIGFMAAEYVNHLNKIRGELGINELKDGTAQPNSKTAVTVQKILLASSNTSTSHIVKASFNLSLAFAKATSHRLVDVLQTPELKERYINIIGTDNVELLEDIKKIPMSKFGIYFDFRPDNEERVTFEESLIRDLSANTINSAQYNKARRIRNTKSAVKYLEFIIKENDKLIQNNKIQNIQAQAEANAQNGILIEKSKQETTTIQFETQKQLLFWKSKFDDRSKRNEILLSEVKAQKDHERAMELKLLDIDVKNQAQKKKSEDSKELVNLQNSNQSQLIDQRTKDTPPIDFTDKVDEIFKKSILEEQEKSTQTV